MEKEDKRLFRIRNVHIKEDPEHKILFNDSLTLAQRPITPYSRKNPGNPKNYLLYAIYNNL